MKSLVKELMAVLFLAMLTACSQHRPAPIEEYSAAQLKRQSKAGSIYRVSSGDTLYAIAFSYGLDHRDVATWNGIPSPYVIYPGQKLRLSPPASAIGRNRGKSSGVQTSGIKTPVEVTTRTLTKNAPTKGKAASEKQLATPQAGSTAKKPPPQTATVKTTSTPGSADPKSWKWPANGRVLRGYVAGNPSRNGLDIAGKEGQPIIASSGGKIVYSGNGLIGYGELIIIKHSERMLSAYAHNKVRLVREGEQVSAGQKIAEMGRNDQNEQLLHFEIRTRGKPVNPLKYLPKK
jgi:lipoprotein NlpD